MAHAPSFIDCDTHFVPLRAMEHIARLHPQVFQFDPGEADPGWIRLLVNGRVLVQSRAGADIAGAGSHGRVDFHTKLASVEQEDPDAVQVLGFQQGITSTNWAPAVGNDLARALNDGVHELLQESPHRDRFIPVCFVYLPWVEEAIRELKRCAPLGFKGVFIGSLNQPYGDLSLGSQGLWRLYEALNELDMPLLYHAAEKQSRDWSSYNWGSIVNPSIVGASHPALQNVGELGLLYGFPFTYACEIANLIFSGTLDRFPRLRFAFLEGRLPSYTPALMDALDQVRHHSLSYKPRRKASEYFADHIYPACTANERFLPYAVQAWPEHTFIAGSDYPHADASGTFPHTVRLIRANALLSEMDKERILWRNAARLFGLSFEEPGATSDAGLPAAARR